jgi:hypothetical protein
MERYEYKLGDNLLYGSNPDAILDELNKKGAEGWELVYGIDIGKGLTQHIYKRKIEDD